MLGRHQAFHQGVTAADEVATQYYLVCHLVPPAANSRPVPLTTIVTPANGP